MFMLIPQPLDTAAYGLLNTIGKMHAFQYNKVSVQWAAWLKAVLSASGLKSCGIYPINPKAVLDHDSCISTEVISKIILMNTF